MTLMGLPIRIDREKVAAFCRGRGIRELSLFGSVLRDGFDPARSDLIVPVVRNPPRPPKLIDPWTRGVQGHAEDPG